MTEPLTVEVNAEKPYLVVIGRGLLGEIVARKLNQASAPTTLFLPLRGVSALDTPGKQFHDPEADAALFDAIRRTVGPAVTLVELDLHINDPAFADAMAEQLLTSLAGSTNAVHRA